MGLTVLIVDDNEGYIAAARGLLEREGMKVLGTASTTAQALERAAALHPDLLLVDIGLKEESGLDVAQAIARDDRLNGSKVILMSAQGRTDIVSLIAEYPVVGFLPKAELSAEAITRLHSGPAGG